MKIKATNILYVILFAVAISSTTLDANADDTNAKTFVATTLGEPSCESWTKNMHTLTDTSKANMQWLIGYISGLSREWSKGLHKDLLEGVDTIIPIVLSTTNYCEKNPNKSVADAGAEYLLELGKNNLNKLMGELTDKQRKELGVK